MTENTVFYDYLKKTFVCPNVPSFEGPEKKLEIDFWPSVNADPRGLRLITRDRWQDMLNEAKCTIISQRSNAFFDSFILSESSLFVYPTKVMVKTCGTTTLLRVIPKLLKIAEDCDLEVDFVQYSRRNFLFPNAQLHPHSGFDHEVEFLNAFFDGNGYVMGPVTGDHWYLYIADYHKRPTEMMRDQSLEIMMVDLDRQAMTQFYKGDHFISTEHVTNESGISSILPGSDIDAHMFDPCGYSMNGLLNEAYSTIHITPQVQCSYVSYETSYSTDSYTDILRRTIDTFKPGRFMVAVVADCNSLAGKARSALDCKFDGYVMVNRSVCDFADNCNLILCHFVDENKMPSRRGTKAVKYANRGVDVQPAISPVLVN